MWRSITIVMGTAVRTVTAATVRGSVVAGAYERVQRAMRSSMSLSLRGCCKDDRRRASCIRWGLESKRGRGDGSKHLRTCHHDGLRRRSSSAHVGGARRPHATGTFAGSARSCDGGAPQTRANRPQCSSDARKFCVSAMTTLLLITERFRFVYEGLLQPAGPGCDMGDRQKIFAVSIEALLDVTTCFVCSLRHAQAASNIPSGQHI